MDKDTEALVRRQVAAFRRLGINVEPIETDTGVAYGAGGSLKMTGPDPAAGVYKDTEPPKMAVVFQNGKLVKPLPSLEEIRTMVREGKLKLHDFGPRRIAEAMVDESIGGKP